MNRLTRQEQLVLCAVFGLLLVGLAVKAYRTSHPGPATTGHATASQTATPNGKGPTGNADQSTDARNQF